MRSVGSAGWSEPDEATFARDRAWRSRFAVTPCAPCRKHDLASSVVFSTRGCTCARRSRELLVISSMTSTAFSMARARSSWAAVPSARSGGRATQDASGRADTDAYRRQEFFTCPDPAARRRPECATRRSRPGRPSGAAAREDPRRCGRPSDGCQRFLRGRGPAHEPAHVARRARRCAGAGLRGVERRSRSSSGPACVPDRRARLIRELDDAPELPVKTRAPLDEAPRDARCECSLSATMYSASSRRWQPSARAHHSRRMRTIKAP